MIRDRIEGNWKQVKGKVQERCGITQGRSRKADARLAKARRRRLARRQAALSARVKARFVEDPAVSALAIGVETLTGVVQRSGFASE